ncbi:ATP/GTP-binding protein, partial [Streptomyces sp. 2MCAF27]
HIINSPFVAQLFQRLLKFGRRLGLSFVAVVHHLSDVVDGAAAREAAAILKMASTRTIYAQKADEARATGRVLGLPRWAVEIIPTLSPGIAVWDVNGNVQVVKHLITEAERPLVYTDRAMTEDALAVQLASEAEAEAEERAAMAVEQQLAHEAAEADPYGGPSYGGPSYGSTVA